MNKEEWDKVTNDEMEEFAKSKGFKQMKGILIDDTSGIKETKSDMWFMPYESDAEVICDVHLDAIVWCNEDEMYPDIERLVEDYEDEFEEWWEKRRK